MGWCGVVIVCCLGVWLGWLLWCLVGLVVCSWLVGWLFVYCGVWLFIVVFGWVGLTWYGQSVCSWLVVMVRLFFLGLFIVWVSWLSLFKIDFVLFASFGGLICDWWWAVGGCWFVFG